MQRCGVSWLLCSQCSMTHYILSVTSTGLIGVDLLYNCQQYFPFYTVLLHSVHIYELSFPPC